MREVIFYLAMIIEIAYVYIPPVVKKFLLMKMEKQKLFGICKK